MKKYNTLMLKRNISKELYIKSSRLELPNISEIQNNKEDILKRQYFLSIRCHLWRTIRMNKITQTNHSSDKKEYIYYSTNKELNNYKTKE
jgi:hypothetical protein